MKNQPIIRNAAGDVIKLTPKETLICNYWEKQIQNALGFDIAITTLTTIVKKVSEQKFFQVAPADYFALKVGEGAWSDQLTTYRSFNMGDQFETGIINTGGNGVRMASVDAGVDSLNIKVYPWSKAIGWSIFELEYASKSGNWDLIAAKEKSRKENWDLGIQRIAFLGARGLNGAGGTCFGLYNQPSVNTNTTVITSAISGLSYTAFNTLVQTIVEAYRVNCNRTAMPEIFVMPESDFNGMAAYPSPQFPVKNALQLLTEAFQMVTGNKNFKVLPCAYGDKAYSGLSTQIYSLHRYDDESLVMNLPVQYTNTIANTLEGVNFQNAGYGMFTGVLAIRPLEQLYFAF